MCDDDLAEFACGLGIHAFVDERSTAPVGVTVGVAIGLATGAIGAVGVAIRAIGTVRHRSTVCFRFGQSGCCEECIVRCTVSGDTIVEEHFVGLQISKS